VAGRLTKYDDSDYSAIIDDLSAGVPLNKAWGGTRPGKTLFHRRVAENAAFAQEYDRAMILRAQHRIARIEDVIEDVLAGRAEPAACKVALDSLWKLAAKEDPKRYSDVQRQEISGANGERLIPESQPLNDFDLARLTAFILCNGTPATNRGELVSLPQILEADNGQ
jgi:hypothetical protein